MASSNEQKDTKNKSSEEISIGFQTLRSEQRQLANKISELEMDLNEHKIVMETLRQVEGGRRCFRLVGGVLVERTVEDILPELESNHEQLPRALANLHEQLAAKGAEINRYIETHNIRIRRAEGGDSNQGNKADADSQQTKSNVLVSSG